jgi:hypothetical protein
MGQLEKRREEKREGKGREGKGREEKRREEKREEKRDNAMSGPAHSRSRCPKIKLHLEKALEKGNQKPKRMKKNRIQVTMK